MRAQSQDGKRCLGEGDEDALSESNQIKMNSHRWKGENLGEGRLDRKGSKGRKLATAST